MSQEEPVLDAVLDDMPLPPRSGISMLAFVPAVILAAGVLSWFM